jgi:chorismate dehydratase
MLRLGHIDYSNCLPVHASLLETPPAGLSIVHGTPGELNQALACGVIDVAPCSSIEYARHAHRYRVLPGLVIGSQGPVQSIRLESTCELRQLGGRTVAVPTASATSVVLLRILLELQQGSQANFVWYEQRADSDPIAQGAAAALWIGDDALRRPPRADRQVHDLGELWTEWTGLPFAFALWQTHLPPEQDHDLQWLAAQLQSSLHSSLADPYRLALRHQARIALPPAQQADYWNGLHYKLDDAMLRGLLRFYEMAAQLGEIAAAPALHIVRI